MARQQLKIESEKSEKFRWSEMGLTRDIMYFLEFSKQPLTTMHVESNLADLIDLL